MVHGDYRLALVGGPYTLQRLLLLLVINWLISLLWYFCFAYAYSHRRHRFAHQKENEEPRRIVEAVGWISGCGQARSIIVSWESEAALYGSSSGFRSIRNFRVPAVISRCVSSSSSFSSMGTSKYSCRIEQFTDENPLGIASFSNPSSYGTNEIRTWSTDWLCKRTTKFHMVMFKCHQLPNWVTSTENGIRELA